MIENSPEMVTSILKRLAGRHASDEDSVCRLAEQALLALADDPSLLDTPDVDKAMFRLVHKIARERARYRT